MEGTIFTEHDVHIPNGETIHYREAGKGPQVILLVHGNMSSSIHWDVVVAELIKNPEYRCVALDQRGFGRSTYKTPVNSIKDFSDDLFAFATALSLKDFILVGWSLGGCISQRFLIDHSDLVKKLILLASGHPTGFPIPLFAEGKPTGGLCQTKAEIVDEKQPWKMRQDKQIAGDVAFVRTLWDAGIYRGKAPEESRYQKYLEEICMQRNYMDVLWALNSYNITDKHNGVVEGTKEVSKLAVRPVLAYHGGNDIICPPAGIEALAKALPDTFKLVVDPASGHSPVTDNLDGVVREFLAFIKS